MRYGRPVLPYCLWSASHRPLLCCPSPKPCPPRSANVRAVLTGDKKLRTRREAKVVGILWSSTLPGGTRFSGAGGRPAARRKKRSCRCVCVGGGEDRRGRCCDYAAR